MLNHSAEWVCTFLEGNNSQIFLEFESYCKLLQEMQLHNCITFEWCTRNKLQQALYKLQTVKTTVVTHFWFCGHKPEVDHKLQKVGHFLKFLYCRKPCRGLLKSPGTP